MSSEPIPPVLPPPGAETYIGDGLYACFDGWQILLRAPREGVDHWVGLEPAVWQALLNWISRYRGLMQHMGGPNERDP